MPLQNRVDPFGALTATPARGTFMGNRGCLHDATGRLAGRPWRSRAWLICLLSFRGRRGPVMAPNRYTRLFFLDEATALAAGHRPCCECRRPDFSRFRESWPWPTERTAGAVDFRLHAERLDGRLKRQHAAAWADLADGTMVAVDGGAWLVRGDALLSWTPAGYVGRRPRPRRGTSTLLTPPSTAVALARGYQPVLHATADLRRF